MPKKWALPAWEGPDSPQTPVLVDEPVMHEAGEEGDQPLCWLTDDAPWGTSVRVTHNPFNVTCPECRQLTDGEAELADA